MSGRLARLIAAGGGSGFSPKAPGTVGSAVAALLGAGLLALNPVLLWPACLIGTVAGFWAVPLVARPEEDPGWVVIDEFAGQWLALTALGHFSWLGVAAGFGLFRLFDIAKPGLIGCADRQGGAFGIMADDLLAGAAAALLLLLARGLGWIA